MGIEQSAFEIGNQEKFIQTGDLVKASGQLLLEKSKNLASFWGIGGMSTLTYGVALTGFTIWVGHEMAQQIQIAENIPYSQALWDYIIPNFDLTRTMEEAHAYYGQWSAVPLAPVGVVASVTGALEIKQALDAK